MLGQWSLEMNHVAAIVGGYNSQQKHIGQNGVRFQLIPRAKQEGGGQVPASTTPSRRRSGRSTPRSCAASNRSACSIGSRRARRRVLNSLLSSARVNRLVEQEAIDGAGRLRAARLPRRRPEGRLQRDLRRRRQRGRCLSPQPAARLRRDAEQPRQRRAGAVRRRARVLPRRAEDARRRPHCRCHSCLGPRVDAARPGPAHPDRARPRSSRPGRSAAGRAGTDLQDEFDVTQGLDSCWIDYAIKPKKR